METKAKDVIGEAVRLGAIPEGWGKVDIDFFQFKNVGDRVQGVLLSKDKITMSKGNRTGKYILKLGERRTSFLGSVQLDEKMSGISLGKEVMVVFTGTQELAEGQNPMKMFEVFYK